MPRNSRRCARAVLVCGFLLVTSQRGEPAAQNANETPYAASRLIARWRVVMTRALEEARASAEEEVTDLLEEFVSPGAVRAVQDKASDEQLKKADAVLEQFVRAIVKASPWQPDGSVVVEEAAHGVCIPEHVKHKLFEPFFTTKKVGKGTSLGTSISYGIIRGYEGTIDIKSQPGQGATFRLTFPQEH